jgi:hypothetical protein
MNVKKLLTKPVTVATSAGLAIAHVLGVGWIDPLVSVLLANIGSVFTALSVSSFTLAKNVSWLPEETLTSLTIVAGGIYVLTLVDRVINQIQTRMDDDTD